MGTNSPFWQFFIYITYYIIIHIVKTFYIKSIQIGFKTFYFFYSTSV